MARADKDDTFREYRKAALEQGWQVVEMQTRWKFIPPNKDRRPRVLLHDGQGLAVHPELHGGYAAIRVHFTRAPA